MADPLAEYEALRDRLRREATPNWSEYDLAFGRLIAQVRALTREREEIRCPVCVGHGWYAVPNRNTGDPEQEQCAACRGTGAAIDTHRQLDEARAELEEIGDCALDLAKARAELERVTRERDEARDYIEHLKRNGNFAIAALGDVGKALAVDRDEARAELERVTRERDEALRREGKLSLENQRLEDVVSNHENERAHDARAHNEARAEARTRASRCGLGWFHAEVQESKSGRHRPDCASAVDSRDVHYTDPIMGPADSKES